MSTRKTLRIEAAGVLLFFLGVVALIFSIVYTFSVLAFIGLGLTFWGAILTYIHSDEYVKGSVLNATATPVLSTPSGTTGFSKNMVFPLRTSITGIIGFRR